MNKITYWKALHNDEGIVARVEDKSTNPFTLPGTGWKRISKGEYDRVIAQNKQR